MKLLAAALAALTLSVATPSAAGVVVLDFDQFGASPPSERITFSETGFDFSGRFLGADDPDFAGSGLGSIYTGVAQAHSHVALDLVSFHAIRLATDPAVRPIELWLATGKGEEIGYYKFLLQVGQRDQVFTMADATKLDDPLSTFPGSWDRIALVGFTNQLQFDNFTIRVSAIPEPSTWAMMIVGFGVAGGAIRRRQVLSAPA